MGSLNVLRIILLVLVVSSNKKTVAVDIDSRQEIFHSLIVDQDGKATEFIDSFNKANDGQSLDLDLKHSNLKHADTMAETGDSSTVEKRVSLFPEQGFFLTPSDFNDEGRNLWLKTFEEFYDLKANLAFTSEKTTEEAKEKEVIDGFAERMKMLLNQENSDKIVPTIKKGPVSVIVLMVVVEEEVQPIYDTYTVERDTDMEHSFHNLCTVNRFVMDKLTTVYVLKTANSPIFKRHYSGHTQAAAIAALIPSVIENVDIVISIGTAGGPNALNPNAEVQTTPFKLEGKLEGKDIQTKIGDVLLVNAILFLDRIRLSSAVSFDWGVWGGLTVSSPKLFKHLEKEGVNVKQGNAGSQLGYVIGDSQIKVINEASILAIDMECAPIAQILNQAKVDFLVFKVISNGVYPGNAGKMEAEYRQNKEEVSITATNVLTKVLNWLAQREMTDL